METQTNSGRSLHPVLWISGIAVTLFSILGIAAMMDWIPKSESAVGSGQLDSRAANQLLPPSAMAPAAQTPNYQAPAHNPARSASTPPAAPKSPVKVANSTPAAFNIACTQCGVIESVREIESKGQGSAIGVIGGAVLGGVLGNQVGAGRGKDLATVVGAVGGAMAGNEVEKRVNSTRSHSVTVRLNDGTRRVFSEPTATSWRTGDKVRISNGAIESNA